MSEQDRYDDYIKNRMEGIEVIKQLKSEGKSKVEVYDFCEKQVGRTMMAFVSHWIDEVFEE